MSEEKPKLVIRVRHPYKDGEYCQVIRIFNDEYGIKYALFMALLDSHLEFEIRFSELEVA